MSESYHNTTGAEGRELEQYQAASERQEDIIARFFRARPYRGFTPSEVQQLTGIAAPLTSVRRAITNLTTAGVLVKLNEQKRGPYGRPEYQWRARPPEPLQGSLFQ